MRISALRPAALPDAPPGLTRLDYVSELDDRKDWALLLPPREGGTWIVCIHGHGSHGDQLYTRRDVRETWLPRWLARGCGVLTPNLRDNAWMSPAAVEDLRALLAHLRAEHAARRFLFFSGSMGGTSNLIYAALHPEDVAGVVALGAVSDLASYHAWCHAQKSPPAPAVVGQIADAVERAYGGAPANRPAPYARHSVLAHADRLAMPLFLAHGAADLLMPVAQSRDLAARLVGRPTFHYTELPGANHDAPLYCVEGFDWVFNAL
jgi:pimeloyl-ACP methyl ester carboxylesterase